MYGNKHHDDYIDNSDDSPFSNKNYDWYYERDPSTGSHHRKRDLPGGGSEYDFGMGGGRVRYDKYGNEY